jgi:hypothetical protein
VWQAAALGSPAVAVFSVGMDTRWCAPRTMWLPVAQMVAAVLRWTVVTPDGCWHERGDASAEGWAVRFGALRRLLSESPGGRLRLPLLGAGSDPGAGPLVLAGLLGPSAR